MKKVFLAMMATLAIHNAWGYCSTPSIYSSPPDPPSSLYRPDKPSPPFCVDTFTNTHTCDEWEIKNYNNALRQYNLDVEDYVRKLKAYVEEAADYLSEAQTFSSDALEYAKCEINDLE